MARPVARPTAPAAGFCAAVFDMDGLLVDSEPLWRQVEMRIFGRLGVPLTEERCRETRGMVVREVARHWYGRFPWNGPAPDDVAAEVLDEMATLLATVVRPKRGALEAVASCRGWGLELAIASSSPRRLIGAVVDRFGLTDTFSVLHSADEEPAGKPDPAVFVTTAALLGVAPGRCVVFEDAPAGVAAAKAAGMVCVAVPETDGETTGAETDGVPGGFEAADLVIGTLDDVNDELWAALAARQPSRRRISSG